jgi:hypothetical protein
MRPRATMDSLPVSIKTGQMERHLPHLAHLLISVSHFLVIMYFSHHDSFSYEDFWFVAKDNCSKEKIKKGGFLGLPFLF